MTVAELIEALRGMDPEALVIVSVTGDCFDDRGVEGVRKAKQETGIVVLTLEPA